MDCKSLMRWLQWLPIPAMRAWLLDRHQQECPTCQAAMLDETRLAGVLHPPAWIEEESSLWPAVLAGIRRRSDHLIISPWVPVRRGLAAAALVLLLCVPVWLVLHQRQPSGTVTVQEVFPTESAPSFALVSAAIDGRPAKPYVVRVPDSDLVIVWLESPQS